MRKSRLSLFKSTSMFVSVIGIILIIATIVVVAYIGFSLISSGITTGVSSGNQYDELADLKSNYTSLEAQFNSSSDSIADNHYDDVRLQLARAQSDVDDVESALAAGKSADEVNDRIDLASNQIKICRETISNYTS
jgi:predicted PurR-regulated permease PerM